MTTTIEITSEQQWLAERARDVTSTEVSALYNLSPYVTEFELWHRKRDRVIEEMRPNERVVWGKRLQDAIAAGVAEDRGWKARRLDVYMRDEADRLGSSFDFEVEDPQAGIGLMEIKNVDFLVFRDEWLDLPSGVEAPQHIELQVQNEMEVGNYQWCALVALVAGNDARVTIRKRDHDIGRDIRKRVRAFWQSVADGKPPSPNYEQDADILCKLHGRADSRVTIDADQELEAWLALYVQLGASDKQRHGIKARVFERTDAGRIRTSFGTFSCTQVADSEGTEITPDMVGKRIGARAGFRQLRFTPNKEKP